MEWIESIREAVRYIEDHLIDDLTTEQVARHICLSPFYFQKGFSMLCGFSVSDYIRQRKLSLAGVELVSTDQKVIDIALKYGYDSPDSFTKAFTRFHGVTPTAVRKDGVVMKSFAPLHISFRLKGGFPMDYKFVEKGPLTVAGVANRFTYDDAKSEIPKFWAKLYQTGEGSAVCGTYGINIDEGMEGKEFEYLIADDYSGSQDLPEGFVIRTIPAFTWAVFPCKGELPAAMQSVNERIFSEWLPGSKDYEIAAGYCVEFYENPSDYANGVQDEDYYCEIWLPVKKKA